MTTQSQAHGMDGSLVATDWPPLTLEELRPLLAEFPACGAPLRILTVSPRPFSSASLVETLHGTVFVKRHHRAVRNGEGLAEEHRFLAHLRARGASVPVVFTSVAGGSAVEQEQWTYEVHSIPAGIDLYQDAISWTPFFSIEQARSAGVALARLHHAALGFDAPARAVQPLVSSFSVFSASDPATELRHYLAARPSIAAHAEVKRCATVALALLAPFHKELSPLLASLAPLWTHNDYHPSNLLWSTSGSGAQVTATIDFGLADRSFAVWDLAQAIERSLVDWLAIVEPDALMEAANVHYEQLDALLDGYESIRPLSASEAAALAPALALCHYEFALTEADYFLGVLHSEEKAIYAYNSYLVGHARWFRTAGQPLLDHLRRRAKRNKDAAR